MTENRVKLGFVGGGFVGQVAHLTNYALNDKCELTALSEVRPLLRQKLERRYGFKKTYASHHEMLADSAIDAVVAVTRRPHIGPVALDILRAGKHLITEKPMCHSVEQARKLVDEAKRRHLIYAVGYMRRHDEGVQAAKALFDRVCSTQELGRLNFVRMHCFGGQAYCGAQAPETSNEAPPEGLPEWPLAPEWLPKTRVNQYAMFLNVFCHNINLLRHFIPKIEGLSHVDLRNEKGGIVVFDLGDSRATLECGQSANHGWDDTVEFFFDSGRIRIELPPALLKNVPASVSIYNANTGQDTKLLPQSWSWAFTRQANAFIDDVLAKRTPIASAEDALSDMALIEEIWKKETHR